MEKILRFEITDRCNLNCWMCWSKDWKHLDMTYLEIEKIIIDFKSQNGQTVVLTSREPLLSPNFIKVLDLCMRECLDIKILTNGTLISKSIAEYLVSINIISFIAVSIHGNPTVHDSVTRVSGSLQQAITGIRNLNEAKTIYKKNMPEIRITSVVSKELLDDLDYVIEIAAQNNSQLRIQHLMWHPQNIKEQHKYQLLNDYKFEDNLIDGFCSKCPVEGNFVIERLEYAKSRCKTLGIDLQIYPQLSKNEIIKWYDSCSNNVIKNARCRHVKDSIRLRANGNVALCQYIDLPLGNLKNDSILSVINNECYLEISKILIEGTIFPICSRCCHIESVNADEDTISNALI